MKIPVFKGRHSVYQDESKGDGSSPLTNDINLEVINNDEQQNTSFWIDLTDLISRNRPSTFLSVFEIKKKKIKYTLKSNTAITISDQFGKSDILK